MAPSPRRQLAPRRVHSAPRQQANQKSSLRGTRGRPLAAMRAATVMRGLLIAAAVSCALATTLRPLGVADVQAHLPEVRATPPRSTRAGAPVCRSCAHRHRAARAPAPWPLRACGSLSRWPLWPSPLASGAGGPLPGVPRQLRLRGGVQRAQQLPQGAIRGAARLFCWCHLRVC